MTLLSIQDLVVSYRSGPGRHRAVDGVSLSVSPGEVVALVGESGSGKSTLAHSVIGLLPQGGRVESGEIRFGSSSTDLASAPERSFRALRGRHIGLVPQDPTVSLNPVQRIGPQVAEVLRIHGLASRPEAAARAVELLERAGLPDPAVRARQYPHELSGGMRQRVLIAIAVAASPSLIIADEPTSALDVTVQRRILDQLDVLRRDLGTAILLITHDLGVAADRADRVVVLSKGKVAESGGARQVLQEPVHPYTRALIRDAPGLSAASAPSLPAPSGGPSGGPLVVAEHLTKEFTLPGGGRNRAVSDVSFSLARGETLALVGESGSGKSTTARLVLGLTSATSGSVRFDGVPVTGASARDLRALRRRMQLVYQNPFASLDPRFSVEQLVTEPLKVFGVGDRSSRRARAAELLDQVALPVEALRSRPAELSGGQRQRVAIARALALSPDLLVCDEPVSALDVTVQAQVLALLTRLQSDLGLTCLFISHDLAVVRRVAHRVGVMRAGHLVELAPTAELFATPRHEYTQELLTAIPGRTLTPTRSS